MRLFKILALLVVVGLTAGGGALAGDQLRTRGTDQVQKQDKIQPNDCDGTCDQTPDRDQLRTQNCIPVPTDASGDLVKARERERDGSCDGRAVKERTRTQTRTQRQDQTCDKTCDQTRTRTRTETQAQSQTQTLTGPRQPDDAGGGNGGGH